MIRRILRRFRRRPEVARDNLHDPNKREWLRERGIHIPRVS